MSLFSHRESQPQATTKRKARRPEGVSRKRKKELGFESLEDRRVMSAQSPLYGPEYTTTSYSSATPEGEAAILQQEIYRALLQQLQSSGVTYDARAIPTDPLLNNQWHLINSGQQVGNPDFQAIFGVAGEDIGVAGVWNQNIFGNGVVVGVFDPGNMQTSHPDLAGNIDPLLSYTGGGNVADVHATAVAGLIGALANNGTGGTGVAPGVTLVPMSGAGLSALGNAGAFIFAMQNGIDIVNNSWGPIDADLSIPRQLAAMTPLEIQALRDSIFNGRDGLGVIYVWASGNGGQFLDSAAYDGYQNSRYVISVTGVDHDGEYNNVDGTVTGYMEAGTSVLVAAPTSSFSLPVGQDTGIGSGIWTTDLTGEAGINQTGFIIDHDYLTDIDYTSRFSGTSAAAPIVSGVVALMLEANPNLSWRDVQEILVRSARQNAEFSTQANGIDKALGIEEQNTWIINQAAIFHDPDVYDPQIPAALQIITPTLDPNATVAFNGLHYAPTPQVLTNGAGYTVSLGVGTNGELVGYGHGVVDAELAVQLAQQWSTKNQHLPNELTFTTAINTPGDNDIPAAEVMPQNTLDFIVPGGLFGDPGFIAYWNEWFDDQPFVDFTSTAQRGLPIELVVPDDNAMTVESVEVSLEISGGTAEALDHLRILLVSPTGTYSELNHYYLDSSLADDVHQASAAGLSNNVYFGEPGSQDNGGNLVATFTTNRNWGERYDSAIVFDPTTGLPIINQGGANVLNPLLANPGEVVQQGWQLIFENYGTTNLNLEDLEITWHGSPIAADTQRIQGLVGVDDDQNDFFNYSRVIQASANIDGDPTTNRLGEVVNIIDPDHESMAANVTVTARRVSDGVIVDRFVTGADGNFYFDLVPDEYIISVEDALGRVALDDSLSPADILQDYQNSWHITEDYFQVWNRDANFEVPIDPNTGAPIPFIDGNGAAVEYGMTGINFLLDPGPPAAPQVQFSGVVNADFNGDGIFNGNDVAVPNVKVYADVNRNGALDGGEIVVTTNASGQYNLVVPNTVATVMNVGVVAPVNWAFGDPTSGFAPLFVEPGDVFTGIDFEITPPLGASVGDGSSNAGYLMGVVYEDANNNGTRQATELGVPGLQVFIDVNNNGTREGNEALTTTNANGAYIFANVSPGVHRVRAVPVAPLLSINPGPGVPRIVTLAGGGTVSQIEFGVGLGSNPATSNIDFGDLPAAYGITTVAENGARHSRSAYFLGARVDVETNGQPSANADGDDNIGGDEDGIVVTPLIPGTTGTLTATASRHGGNLQGWVDFNGDFDFNDPGERILTNAALLPGVNNLTFEIPATLAGAGSATGGVIYARFRYGEYGINSVTGAAAIGEVEDYVLAKDPSALPAVIEHGPDFDEDGDVDGRDFLILQRNWGRTNATGIQGDANGDGVVGYNDQVMWRNYYGSTAGSFSAFTADDDEDEPAAVAAVDEPLEEQVAVVLAGVDDQPEEAPLVEAILIVDTDSSANVIEVSAQASTSVVPGQIDVGSVAAALELLSGDSDVDSEADAVVLEAEDLDAVFDSSSDLADLGLALKKDESGAYRYDDEDLASESEEDNVFALAFAEEADWRQF